MAYLEYAQQGAMRFPAIMLAVALTGCSSLRVGPCPYGGGPALAVSCGDLLDEFAAGGHRMDELGDTEPTAGDWARANWKPLTLGTAGLALIPVLANNWDSVTDLLGGSGRKDKGPSQDYLRAAIDSGRLVVAGDGNRVEQTPDEAPAIVLGDGNVVDRQPQPEVGP